jgi:hypothetical protein
MDYKLIVSIYAAIISTFVLIWRLYEFYYDRRGKFTVKIKRNTKITYIGNSKLGDSQMYLTTTIINVGKTKRLIEQPCFISNVKMDNGPYINFLMLTNIIKYPITLDCGEKFEYEVPYEAIEELKEKDVLKIKAIIRDTHGKSHYSNWFKI